MGLRPLKAAQFAAFERELWDREPFPWQMRLCERACVGDWPPALEVPTASGKTTAIDIAVFALAVQAEHSVTERTAPLRTFFVVDRRLVVDEAHEHALALAARLRQASVAAPEGVLARAAERLARFGGEVPLAVSRLRGGVAPDNEWALSPAQPAVVLSTVDQFGSRLLFRGYGVSARMRPVHAALCGFDALVILDEAQLSRPLEQTVEAVRRYQERPPEPAAPPLRLVRASATLPERRPDTFMLEEADRRHDHLGRRLSASKRAQLYEGGGSARLAREARRLSQGHPAALVGVVCNLVATAREVYEALRPHGEAVLLIGPSRPYDRDRLLAEWGERLRSRSARSAPLFLVATQTVEVGANLDFDALVTESAPLSALRQRFGRLDRYGELRHSEAAIVKAKGAEHVYGRDVAEQTWEWLNQAAADGALDFGPAALEQTLSKLDAPPEPEPSPAPVLAPAHLESLVQTSPEPFPDPDPEPFLHGREGGRSADLQLVWRADLDPERPGEWASVVALCPPLAGEMLPVSIATARRWLVGQAANQLADVEGIEAEESSGQPRRRVLALRWLGEGSELLGGPGVLRPGDVVVLPSAAGGADRFGFDPTSTEPVPDVGDLCTAESDQLRPRLRLAPGALDALAPGADTEAALARARELAQAISEGQEPEHDLSAPLERLRDGLQPAEDSLAESLLSRLVSALADPRPAVRIVPYPNRLGVVLLGPRPPRLRGLSHGRTDRLSLVARAVSLKDHSQAVEERTSAFAAAVGLAPALREALEAAARWHDVGKADPRMQAWLVGGSPLAAPELLAKSGMDPDDQETSELARRRAAYPRGARHEFLSATLFLSATNALGHTEEERDLVAHLVATHHGFARALPAPSPVDDGGVEVELRWDGAFVHAHSAYGFARLDSGWLERFARLHRRFGPWGLAYIEAVLRLADITVSQEGR